MSIPIEIRKEGHEQENTIDFTENQALRLMAALSAEEIRDFFNGADNKEDAERALKLLLQIIDEVVPKGARREKPDYKKEGHRKAGE